MKIEKYTISNEYLRLTTLNIGAVIYELEVKKNDKWQNVVVNFEDINTYLNSPGYIGVGLCGRFAGRVRDAKFNLNGEIIQLDKNFKGNHHLHGGFKGIDKLFGDVEVENNKIKYKFYDPEGQYPGNLSIELTYELKENKLMQTINATSDKDTIFNPTNHNHAYFNFDMSNNILDYQINMNASKCYYLDDDSLPTEEKEIENSIFAGLNNTKKIGELKLPHEQFDKVTFIDHPFVLESKKIKLSNKCISMQIETNQKALVIYTGNYMDEITQKMNVKNVQKYMGICLETQMLPDCVNMENNNDALLLKGEEKSWYTSYAFE